MPSFEISFSWLEDSWPRHYGVPIVSLQHCGCYGVGSDRYDPASGCGVSGVSRTQLRVEQPNA